MTPEQEERLVRAAWAARENAYAPYSRFRVGAAVMAEDGAVFTGCNVENASYGMTLCAERVAVARAVAEGHRQIVAVAVVADSSSVTTPCGACRQVLAEFAGPGAVVVADSGRARRRFTLGELLPEAFSGSQLPRTLAGGRG